jgi:Spy/CpxP family protein refolding chaperone
MWKKTKPLLVILSVALNLAFVGAWLTYAAASRMESRWEKPCVPGDSQTVWCPLHRELNVTAEQWKEIEPRLRAFRTSADEICGKISGLRAGIIDELASPSPDLQAIKAKQEEIRAGQRRMQGLVIEQLMSERKVLTAEQQQRLFDMLRSRMGCDRGGPMLVPGRGHEGSIGQPLRTGGED